MYNSTAQHSTAQHSTSDKRVKGNPLVSIIIPVWNTKPEYLEQCFESITAQTFNNWKVHIVDNGSTSEETVSKLKEWAGNPEENQEHTVGKDPRFKYTRKEHGGFGYHTRKPAIQTCDTEWVLCLDSDDWIEPDFLERLFRRQQETGADEVLPILMCVNDDGNRNGDQFPRFEEDGSEWDYSKVVDGKTAFKWTIPYAISAGNGISRTETLQAALEFTDFHFEKNNTGYLDELFGRVALLSTDKVAFEDTTMFYRKSGQGITQALSLGLWGHHFTTLDVFKLIDLKFEGEEREEWRRQLGQKDLPTDLMFAQEKYSRFSGSLQKSDRANVKRMIKELHEYYQQYNDVPFRKVWRKHHSGIVKYFQSKTIEELKVFLKGMLF